MATEKFEDWFKTNKAFNTPISEYNKAALDICRGMTQQNLELINESISLVSQQFKELSSVRNPKDYLDVLKNCINEDITASVNNVQKIIHTSMEGAEKLTSLCGTMCESSMMKKETKEKTKHEK